MIYILEKVKLELRIKNDLFDMEISDLIEACKTDLYISGISKEAIEREDSLILRAIKLYCKSNFGMDNKDSLKYQNSYDTLKIHLALSSEYGD